MEEMDFRTIKYRDIKQGGKKIEKHYKEVLLTKMFFYGQVKNILLVPRKLFLGRAN